MASTTGLDEAMALVEIDGGERCVDVESRRAALQRVRFGGVKQRRADAAARRRAANVDADAVFVPMLCVRGKAKHARGVIVRVVLVLPVFWMVSTVTATSL